MAAPASAKSAGSPTSNLIAMNNSVLTFAYRAIRPSRLSGVTTFCCGILDSPEVYSFDDGSRPETPSIVEVSQAAHQNAVWLDWQPGDLLAIDNTRVMHAREAFEDPNRRILVRYSALR